MVVRPEKWDASQLGFRGRNALRSAPPHTGSPGPFKPGTPEESEKSPERVSRARAQKCPKSAPRSLERVRKESKIRLLDSFKTPGAHSLGCPEVLFPDSFRTLLGFRARRARETLCGAGPIAMQCFRWARCATHRAPKWPVWAHLFQTVLHNLGRHAPARCMLYRIAFPLCTPNSHLYQEPPNAPSLHGLFFFSYGFQEVKRPLRTKSVKRPIKVGKRPINDRNGPLRPWCWLAFQSAA